MESSDQKHRAVSFNQVLLMNSLSKLESHHENYLFLSRFIQRSDSNKLTCLSFNDPHTLRVHTCLQRSICMGMGVNAYIDWVIFNKR